MQRILLIIICLQIPVTFFAQQSAIRNSIPENYEILNEGITKGDLNKDGIEDVVLALSPVWEKVEGGLEKSGIDSIPQRLLIILFGTKTGYEQSVITSKAIMCKDCGGIFGDPFAGIAIIGNVLEIYHYGGSNWRWSYTHKFRYQGNGFYLIGRKSISYWNVMNCEKLDDFAGTDYEDINFITGQFEIKKISEDCKLLEDKKGKRKTQPLIALEKFEIDN